MSMDYRRIYTIEVGWWLWKRKRTFKGSCTVFHDVETGEMASGSVERQLCDMDWLAREKEARDS